MKAIIYWIDENAKSLPNEAIQDALAEAAGRGTHVIAEQAKPDLLSNLRVELAKETVPVLVVLDYLLTGLGPSSGGPKTEYGSNWSLALRSSAPNAACVGVTSQRMEDVPQLAKEQFITFFDRDNVFRGLHYNDLGAILRGFPRLRSFGTSSTTNDVCSGAKGDTSEIASSFLGLLKAPKNIKDLLCLALPETVIGKWDEQTVHSVSRWIWHVLLRRPGFLADRLEAATLLGLSEKGFDAVCEHFNAAKYQGIFCSEDSPRWWTRSLHDCASKLVNKRIFGPIWNERRAIISKVIRTRQDYFSRPYGRTTSNKPATCVAYKDSTRSERVAALEEDTALDERELPPFGFEKNRIYRGKDWQSQ